MIQPARLRFLEKLYYVLYSSFRPQSHTYRRYARQFWQQVRLSRRNRPRRALPGMVRPVRSLKLDLNLAQRISGIYSFGTGC